MAKIKVDKEEREREITRALEAAGRQCAAALNCAKFVKDACGRYHFAVKDIGEARRWIRAAQGHFAEALQIFDVLEEQ